MATIWRNTWQLLPVLSLTVLPIEKVWASGFAIPAQSASSVGTAGASDVAGVQDASAIFSNPAAMGAFKGHQLSLGLASLKVNSKFSDGKRTVPGTNLDAGDPNSSSSGFIKPAMVPSVFGVHPLNDAVNLGWSLTVPWGTHSDYGNEWVGRYQGTQTELTVINLDLGGSYRINSKVVLGFGVQAQKAKGKIAGAGNGGAAAVKNAAKALGAALPSHLAGTDSTAYNALSANPVAAAVKAKFEAIPAATVAADVSGAVNTAAAQALPTFEGKNDLIASYEGSDISYGFVLGVMYDPTDDLRVGFSYRSGVKHKSKGTISFDGETALGSAAAAQQPAGDANLQINLPDVIGLGVSYKALQDLMLYGNVTYTKWSSLDKLDTIYAGGAEDTLVQLDWKNSYAIAVGGTYKLNTNFLMRAGLGIDQSPTPDQYRTPRAPDGDRKTLALGLGYQRDNWQLDAGLSHTMVKDSTLQLREADYPGAAGRGNLDGSYKLAEDTFMIQYGLAL